MTRLLLGCPFCGAQIESLEEEHVVRCSFCSSKLLASVRGGSPAYTLSPKIQEQERIRFMFLERVRRAGTDPARLSSLRLTHLPFWRLQAVSYKWVFGSKSMGRTDPTELLPPPTEKVRELVVRPLDHSISASPGCGLDMKSLGVRTQVLPLSPAAPEQLRQSSLPVEVSRAEAMEALERLTQGYPQPQGLTPETVLETLVGVRLSLVFFPVWEGTVRAGEEEHHFFLDGLEGTLLGKTTQAGSASKYSSQGAMESYLGELRLLPFRCPNCGWDLTFRPSSLLHLCPSCLRLWSGHEGGWKEIPYEAAVPPGGKFKEELLWVPFWCFQCRYSDGRKVVERASELRGLALQAAGPGPRPDDKAPLVLYVPGIRLPDPKVSMGLAVRLTGAQPNMIFSGFPPGMRVNSAGASLSVQDAGQMALPVLAGLIPFRNRHLLNWLGGVKAELGEAKVRFLPFARKDIFWMELHSKATFAHNPRCADLLQG